MASHSSQSSKTCLSAAHRVTAAFLLWLCVLEHCPAQSKTNVANLNPLFPYRSATKGAPNPLKSYRIVFDLNSPAPHADESNPGLIAVAGLWKTYAQYGVPTARRKFVVMLRSNFVEIAESDASYGVRHPGQSNPDSAMLRTLLNAGVTVAVDERDLIAHGLKGDALQKGVEVHVAAKLTFLDLEAEGYVYTSTRSLLLDR